MMNRRSILTALMTLLAAALLLPTLAGTASADVYREFTGRIDQIKKQKFIVDNRQGDKVQFIFIKDTEVTGEKKTVKKIKKGDWVKVSWKFVDKPRKAYKIIVLPPREEEE
jgi:hypothetical protein